jgi:hypothetical protein
MGNRETGRIVWEFVRNSWDQLLERFPAGSIVRMVSSVAGITEREWAAEVQEFFDTHPVPQGEKTLAQNLERMWNSVRLKERESESFAANLA